MLQLQTECARPSVRRCTRAGERVSGIPARRPMVVPFARALSVLGAFTPRDLWLGNRDLMERTELPASTVSRLAQSLVACGYLHYSPEERKYRLAASVLGLGYAAIANSDVQRMARAQMQAFAAEHKVHVCLSARDRLDLVVLESCSGPGAPLEPQRRIGAREAMATSPIGWALLGSLPEAERYFLLSSVERRMPSVWPRLRHHAVEAIAQVYEKGYCSTQADDRRNLGMLATPVLVEGHEPRVLACVGASTLMSRPRIERELGPRLLAMARAIQGAEARP